MEQRTYFRSKKTGTCEYLADKAFGITSHMRKRKKKVLYINADEDHVSLQFRHKKGDLTENENGYKNNTVMPKLIYVFEGIRKEGPKSKRNQLINKHCFGGVYSDSEKLWEEVMAWEPNADLCSISSI
ncbi:MAG TPA: hypothetical protein DDX29_00055 [Clostridiales bacterium]|nr:hypothetical protein [Clostridiales bacterium]